jgi:hypothetical protein
MWWIIGVVAVVVLAATYVTWLAARVDRLHARAAAAHTALDAHLVRRAATALELATALDSTGAAGAAPLRRAAHAALDDGPAQPAAEDRPAVENDLTLALRALPAVPAEAQERYAAVVGASRRVALSRQVHDDLVRDARAMRRRRLVRLFRLTRRHPEPRYFDVDDPMIAEPSATQPG